MWLEVHIYRAKTTELAGPLGTIPQEPWHPGKGAKPHHIINYDKVHTHTSYKTTKTWENFNNKGIKMILLSNKLWLIANNSKSFANGSKSVIRNNLCLCNCSDMYLIYNFPKHCHGSNSIKILIWQGYMKQINDIQEWQKIMVEFSRKICLKRIRSYDTGEERGASRHFFASNDKNRINLKLITKNQFKVNYIRSIKMNFWWAI